MVELESQQLAFSGREWERPRLTAEDLGAILSRIEVETLSLEGSGYSKGLWKDGRGKWRWLILINKNKDYDEQLLTFVHEVIHIYWGWFKVDGGKNLSLGDEKESLIEDEAGRFFEENPELVAQVFDELTLKKD